MVGYRLDPPAKLVMLIRSQSNLRQSRCLQVVQCQVSFDQANNSRTDEMSLIRVLPTTLRTRIAFAGRCARSMSKLRAQRRKREQKSIDSLVGLFHRSATFPPLSQTSTSGAAGALANESVDFASIGASGSSPRNIDEYLVARLASYRKARQLLPAEARSSSSSRLLGSGDLADDMGDVAGESMSGSGVASRWQPFDSKAATASSLSSEEARLRGLRVIDALHGTALTQSGKDYVGAKLALDWSETAKRR